MKPIFINFNRLAPVYFDDKNDSNEGNIQYLWQNSESTFDKFISTLSIGHRICPTKEEEERALKAQEIASVF